MYELTPEFNHYRYEVPEDYAGRIDTFLKERGFSSRLISSIKRKGQLLRNDRLVRFVDKVVAGDTVEVVLPTEHVDCEAASGYKLDIIYEDDEILVVNKPPYVVTHPTIEYTEHTLANYVASYYKETGQNVKIRFVNRLDRDTTGLIIIAKNKFVHHYIQSRMGGDEVKKTYLAITEGEMESERGTIELPIYRPDPETIERVVDERGKPSITHYRKIESIGDVNLVECELETGRTHQIRVHMKAEGTPIIGDPLYNPESTYDFPRQALHAWKLEFSTPKAGKLKLEAPIPEDMVEFSSRLRK